MTKHSSVISLFVCGVSLTSGQLVNDRIYEMRCPFVAVGLDGRFIVLPHCSRIAAEIAEEINEVRAETSLANSDAADLEQFLEVGPRRRHNRYTGRRHPIKGVATLFNPDDPQYPYPAVDCACPNASVRALRQRRMTLHWIPSHVGIHNNEEADRAAKRASKRRNVLVSVKTPSKEIWRRLTDKEESLSILGSRSTKTSIAVSKRDSVSQVPSLPGSKHGSRRSKTSDVSSRHTQSSTSSKRTDAEAAAVARRAELEAAKERAQRSYCS